MKHTLRNGPDNFIRKNRVVYLKCRIVHGHAGGSGAAGKGAKRVQLQENGEHKFLQKGLNFHERMRS